MLRILKAFQYALQGIFHALRNEFAFQIEFSLALILIPLSFFIGENAVEVAFLVFSTLFILIVELLNTSIEKTLDRYNKDKNELTGIAKDYASGAVLLSIVNWIITWGLVLFI